MRASNMPKVPSLYQSAIPLLSLLVTARDLNGEQHVVHKKTAGHANTRLGRIVLTGRASTSETLNGNGPQRSRSAGSPRELPRPQDALESPPSNAAALSSMYDRTRFRPLKCPTV